MSRGGEDPRLRARAREDAARALPVLGLLLLVSPLLDAFGWVGRPFGIPAAYFYLFAAWAFLIALTARLSRRLVGPPPRG
ncbi:MAG: hypothetical protein AAF281_06040 [Pseudomonadota bacterium]